MALEAVAVDPLSLAHVATVPDQPQDGTTADVGVTVLFQGAVEPTDAGGSRKGVDLEGPDGVAVVAVDGVTHQVSVCCGQCKGFGGEGQGPQAINSS